MKSHKAKDLIGSFIDRNRLVIAFLLSGIVLVGYSWMFAPENLEKESVSFIQKENSVNTFERESLSDVEEEKFSLGTTVWIEGEVLRVGIETRFGSIRNVILKETEGRKEVDLSCYKKTPQNMPGVLQVDQNFFRNKNKRNDSASFLEFSRVHTSRKRLPRESSLILETDSIYRDPNVQFVREYQIDGYKVQSTLQVKGIDRFEEGKTLKIYNGTCIREKETVKSLKVEDTSFDIGTVSYTKNSQNQEALPWRFKHFWSKPESQEEILESDWIGVDDRFYLRALEIIGSAEPNRKAFFYKKGSEIYSGYEIPLQISTEKAKEIFRGNFWFLPKNRGLLNGIYTESRSTFYLIYRQFSFMKILSDFLYSGIVLVYNRAQNYGFALILVTVLLKIIVFPFARRSHLSMKKMQMVEPRIRELRQKYKDNTQLASVKLMQLYQQEKINPASGCLATLLPAPFFIALYSLFQNMVELEGQSFLWIKDLAFPDIITSSYRIPLLGGGIRILPFLVAISHVLQMRFLPKPVETKESDAIQAQVRIMNYFLPGIFFLICWKLPSGLVLFWLVQNILSVFQSLYFLSFDRELH